MNLEAFLSELGDIPVLRDAATVKLRSRDFFWYSPALKRQLNHLTGDVVVCPRDQADLAAMMRAAVRHRINVTARGGGTGNYGQAVPLQGGAVADLTGLDRILWIRDGKMRIEAGCRLIDLDRALRGKGWELRMFPSTKRTATIGGFISGGSGGIGSITWGGLRDAGNILATRVLTAEPEPRFVELRGARTDLVNHTYGTTGLITELELPVAPAMPWQDVMIAFEGVMQAAVFCLEAARNPAIDKKLCTTIDPAIVPSFKGLRELAPEGAALALLMVAPSGMLALGELAARHGGRILLERPTLEAENSAGETPLYEYTWNHTTLQMLKLDRTVTYLQCLFAPADPLAGVDAMRTRFGSELMTHLEFMRVGGAMTCSGLPVIRFSSEERLSEIIALHEAAGVMIANPHVYTIEDGGGHKRLPGDTLGFKHEVDPRGLLNPGKMRDYRLPDHPDPDPADPDPADPNPADPDFADGDIA